MLNLENQPRNFPLNSAQSEEKQVMETIVSNDGTLIAYQRSGTGAPLVLVHGTLSSHGGWATILPKLEKQFTVYAIDRRGRGESGDPPGYAIEREYEDITALVNSIGGGVNLFGHSYGGLIALEAALLTPSLRRLIVYEPSSLPTPGVPLYPQGTVDRLQALLDAGDRAGVVMSVFRDLVNMPTDELELFKASPRFPAWVAAAHTVPRETRAEEDYQFEPERFQNMHEQTLLLLGGDSPPEVKRTVESWHAALSNSRIVTLPGQQHMAHFTAPDLFMREVEAFLLEPDG
jgi:pimeloyl-ACP methyl ester carboxylesterase